MTLIAAKQKPIYKWHPGDLITTTAAAELLGYSSPRNLQGERLNFVVKEFEALRCKLTTKIIVGGQRRFLRSEIDTYLSRIVEKALAVNV